MSTLVIGCGGTGARVCLEAKKIAQDRNLDNFKILIFDLDAASLAEADDSEAMLLNLRHTRLALTDRVDANRREIRRRAGLENASRERLHYLAQLIGNPTFAGVGNESSVSAVACWVSAQAIVDRLVSGVNEIRRHNPGLVKLHIVFSDYGGTGSGMALSVLELLRTRVFDECGGADNFSVTLQIFDHAFALEFERDGTLRLRRSNALYTLSGVDAVATQVVGGANGEGGYIGIMNANESEAPRYQVKRWYIYSANACGANGVCNVSFDEAKRRVAESIVFSEIISEVGNTEFGQSCDSVLQNFPALNYVAETLTSDMIAAEDGVCQTDGLSRPYGTMCSVSARLPYRELAEYAYRKFLYEKTRAQGRGVTEGRVAESTRALEKTLGNQPNAAYQQCRNAVLDSPFDPAQFKSCEQILKFARARARDAYSACLKDLQEQIQCVGREALTALCAQELQGLSQAVDDVVKTLSRIRNEMQNFTANTCPAPGECQFGVFRSNERKRNFRTLCAEYVAQTAKRGAAAECVRIINSYLLKIEQVRENNQGAVHMAGELQNVQEPVFNANALCDQEAADALYDAACNNLPRFQTMSAGDVARQYQPQSRQNFETEFKEAFIAKFPSLCTFLESRLNDENTRQNAIERLTSLLAQAPPLFNPAQDNGRDTRDLTYVLFGSNAAELAECVTLRDVLAGLGAIPVPAHVGDRWFLEKCEIGVWRGRFGFRPTWSADYGLLTTPEQQVINQNRGPHFPPEVLAAAHEAKRRLSERYNPNDPRML